MDDQMAVSAEASPDWGEATLDFETFFEAEMPRVFRAARLLTGSHHDAEELCQEAFFRIWQRWDRVRAMEDPRGYLYRTVLNDHRKRYRRALRKARQVIRPASVDDPQLTIQARDTFARWLASLTPRQRTAVILTHWLAQTTAETAAAMGVKPGTVHVLLSQAKASLEEAMGSNDA
jgi:RNA polymerase sigma factor (sigma-70 family)